MSFDVAAESYDRYMGAWSSQLSSQLAELAGVRAGQRVVDVGCGPGALTAELVARIGAEAVAAVDPSASFVTAARTRHPGVDVREAPAENLPYPNDTFDTALAQLVVHFMANPIAGLREMARVTRRGGVVAACVWDFGGGRGPLGPFWEAVRETDPNAVDESNLAGARQGQLAELFEAAGLSRVEEATLVARRAYGTFEDWWEPFTRGVGPGGVYVAALNDVRKTELRERCRSMLPAGPIDLTAAAWAARGVVEG
jgi:SAM-dependent methyltransferase